MGLLYRFKAHTPKEEIIQQLREHPEIKFVSLMGIDLAGNDTDEKIPVQVFIKNIDEFFTGRAVQTDGSSVVLPGIATLNNAKVDMPIDHSVNWFVDYNFEHYDNITNCPVGTLRIPAFLIHEGKRVDSRSVLTDTLIKVKQELVDLFHHYPDISGLDVDGREITDISFTAATELEFWVKTPLEEAAIEEMTASQVMQEQYWERTHGAVRCALEQSLIELDKFGLHVEMGHKEVGGLKAQIDESGHLTHVCEQLEIDWRYDNAVQAADNEIIVRTVVKEIFRANGLEVSFKAKPMVGLAGNGEHTHLGIAAITADGKVHNIFSAKNPSQDYMSAVGYGALMGLLKNYEVINPFVSATNDSINRLKPGFEAPVCIVTSLGHTPKIPSRNRTILVSLIRDLENPMATRFELRGCNPYTNIYLVTAAAYSAILDGIKMSVTHTTEELLAELSKDAGVEGFYLEKDRAYRSEEDVYEAFTEDQRSKLFGKPPETVFENLDALNKYPDKVKVITSGGALTDRIINSFKSAAILRWKTEWISRILPELRTVVRNCQKIDSQFLTDQDAYNWHKIFLLRSELAKDSIDEKSLFTQLITALKTSDYARASELQVIIYDKIEELKALYDAYEKNMI